MSALCHKRTLLWGAELLARLAFGAEHLSQQRSSNFYHLGSGESVVSEVTLYHKNCGTSRNVLGLIRNAGIEPTVIEYLKHHQTGRPCSGSSSAWAFEFASYSGVKARPMMNLGSTIPS